MGLSLDHLQSEALALPARDRAALAHRLILSLDESDEDDPTEVELAWEEEIRRRLDAHRRGDAESIASSDVFANARELLRVNRGVTPDAAEESV